jgi:hypothetical protein
MELSYKEISFLLVTLIWSIAIYVLIATGFCSWDKVLNRFWTDWIDC